MSLIVAIILGGLVGWIAARLLGRDEGAIASVIIGVIGSFIGSVISSAVTGSDRAYLDFSWSGLLWSLIGAVVLVGLMNTLSHRHHTPNA
jgi:uncharacterized membrane protein YeaQ/YmgE (transglycosylase-associated protein family)